ncbi:MAG: hypothetical protein ACI9VR_002382 [Cognaticolwellia sp.]|jgi:hypothetical protein
MLLFTLAGCWLGGFAVIGDDLSNDFVVESETGWDVASCGWVLDYSPATRELIGATDLEIQIRIDGEFNGDGSIIGVETELRESGDTVTILPTEPLLPNTTYTWWLDTGCQYIETTFVTSAYGGELIVIEEDLTALSYDLLMSSQATLVIPALLGSELEGLLRGWVWGRGSMDETGTLTLSQVDAGAQDFCSSTQQLQGFFSYPAPQVTWTGQHIALATDLGALDMEELRIDAIIAPDGLSLGEVAVSGLIGVNQLNTYYGMDYCELLSAQDVGCVGCEDPEGCVRVRVEGAAGRVKESVVQAVDQDFCHEACQENSEDCEL